MHIYINVSLLPTFWSFVTRSFQDLIFCKVRGEVNHVIFYSNLQVVVADDFNQFWTKPFLKVEGLPTQPCLENRNFLSCVYKKTCNTSGKLTWEWKQKTVWRCISYEKLGDFPANHVSFRVGNSSKLCFSTTYVIPKDFRSQPKSWRVNKPFKSTA